MEKIYITGIYGMLGYKLATLCQEYFHVCGCDLADADEKFAMEGVTKLDLTDKEKVKDEFSNIKPDVIVHTAAMINVDACEKNPDLAYAINSELVSDLAAIADSIEARFIYISTDAVFDGQKDKCYSEGDETNPLNIYGKSKLLGEEKTLRYERNLVIRTNIYGWNIQRKTSFAEWVYNSLAERKQIKMFTDLLYTPIYVGDLSEIIIDLVRKDISGLFHVVGNEECSKYDFGIALASVFSLDKNLIEASKFSDHAFGAKRSGNMRLCSGLIQKKTDIVLPNLINGLKKFKEDGLVYGKF